MTKIHAFSLLAIGLLCGTAPARAASATKVQAMGAPIEGTATGDVNGDGRLETAVLTRVGKASGSSISLWDGAGTLLWKRASAVELAGSPLVADLNGDGQDEVAYCELSDKGYCHVLGAQGELKAKMGPFYFPGMTTSGPSATDVTGDGVAELVVATFGGLVAAFRGTGQQVWATDLWQLHGEQIFGHPAIGDLDGNGTPEIVVAGYNWGTVFSLDGRTGAVKWASQDPTGQCFAYANGALLTDMDGNGTREVVVAMAAANEVDTVFVLDGKTGLERGQLSLPGAILSFMTPVAADVDGNGRREVFLQGGDGRLRELAFKQSALSVSRSLNLGAESWVAPAFVDLNLDGAFEIAAATKNQLLFLDGKTFAVRDTYSSKLGGLMPTPVVGDVDRNGTIDLLLGSWLGETLERVEFAAQSASSWKGLGGGPTRSGEQAPAAILPSNSAWDGARDKVLALITGGSLPASAVQTMRTRVLPMLDSAELRVLRGDIEGALDRAETAIQRLERDVKGYDSTALRRELAELAIATAQMYRERVAAFAGAPALAAADQDLQRARSYLAANNPRAAADAAGEAAEDVAEASERVRTFVRSGCRRGTDDPVLDWECQLLDIHAGLVGKTGHLDNARQQLEDAIVDLADLDFDSALADLEDAISDLGRQSGTSSTQAAITTAAERLTRLYLDDVTLAGVRTAAQLSQAERAYGQGKTELARASYARALDYFQSAASAASP